MNHPRTAVLPLLLATAACGRGGDAATPPVAFEEVATPAAEGSGEGNLTVGPDGRAYLSWIEPAPDSAHALRFAVLEEGGWSEPRTIAQGRGWFVNWADFPALAVLPGGRMAAHWLQRSGTGTYAYDVRVSVSSDGGRSWTPGVSPHTDGTQTEHGFASLWPAGADSVAMVWLDGRKFGSGGGHDGHDPANEMTLRYATIGPDGGVSPELEIDGRVCDCCQTGAAMTSAGPVVVYRDRTAEEIRDIYVTRRVGGAWTEGRPVHDDGWRIEGCPVNGPQVAAEGERVAVAWYTAPGDSARVLAAFSDDAGASFGPPVRVDDGQPAGRVDVVLLPGGDALVSWMEQASGGVEIRLRRVSPAGTAGPAHRVAETSGARSSGFPRMVRAGDQLVVAWTATSSPARVRTARVPVAALERGR